MASSPQLTGVVVWEWNERPHIWIPYSVKVARFLEKNYLKPVSSSNADFVNLGDVEPYLTSYVVNLGTMEQMRVETGTTREVRRMSYPPNSVPGRGIIWEWQSDDGWMPYDIITSELLEKALKCKDKFLDLERIPLAIPNFVDIVHMCQINKYSQFPRQVHRLTSQKYPKCVSVSKMSSTSSAAHCLDMNSIKSVPVMPRVTTSESPTSDTTACSFGAAWCVVGEASSLLLGNAGSVTGGTVPVSPGNAVPVASSPIAGSIIGDASPFSFATAGSVASGPAAVSSGKSGSFRTSLNARCFSKEKKPIKRKVKEVSSKARKAADVTATDPISRFCSDLDSVPDEECAICFEKLSSVSSFSDESQSSGDPLASSSVKQLNKCKHSFHPFCLQAMYDSGTKDGSLQCPSCKTIHGVKYGNQPKNGTMDVNFLKRSLPGHPGCRTIVITYNFTGGVQGTEHPNPGQSYSARGFPRTCYLPDSKKGRKVLKLLKTAWGRRLIFTVGFSTTTGEQDTVIWNEIHHKTEGFTNHMGHGYPDPSYLDNVLTELAIQGVEDNDDTTVGEQKE